MQFRKRLISWSMLLFGALLLALSGCQSSNIQVTSKDGSSPTPAAPLVSPNVVNAPNTQIQEQNSVVAGTVAFERVLMERGEPQMVIAVSSTRSDSQSTLPFGVSLRVPRPFVGAKIYSADGGLHFLRSSSFSKDGLVGVSPLSGQSHSVFEFPSAVRVFSFDAASRRVAWAGAQSGFFVSTPVQVAAVDALDSVPVQRLQWSADGAWLLEQSADGSLLLYAFPEKEAAPRLSAAFGQVVAFAFSPEGSRFAFVNKYGALFLVSPTVDGVPRALEPLAVLQTTELHDLSWKDARTLSYWVRLSAGQDEIRLFDLRARVESFVLAVSGPDGPAADGVVCPVWLGDTVYFSTHLDDSYAIESANWVRGGHVAQPRIVAAALSLDEGFICPGVEVQP